MKTSSLTLFVVLTLVSGLAQAAGDVEASGLSFRHELHTDLDCTDCHAAEESHLGTDLLLPEKDVCADCHDVESDDECGYCHIDVDDPMGYADVIAKVDLFSHAAHVESGMDCAQCHGTAEAIVAAPPKSDCRGCHVTASNLEDCSVCHSKGAEYVPSSHGSMFEFWHGIEAGSDQQDCSNCHTQSDCQSCHVGDNVRPRSHRLNFAFDHSIEARTAEMECSTCHADPGFCSSCHVGFNVLPDNHSRADWVLPGGDGGEHAIEALLEMESCVSCHDQGEQSPICASCHGE